jgi:tetratricopeptide (TPR) repeat protein
MRIVEESPNRLVLRQPGGRGWPALKWPVLALAVGLVLVIATRAAPSCLGMAAVLAVLYLAAVALAPALEYRFDRDAGELRTSKQYPLPVAPSERCYDLREVKDVRTRSANWLGGAGGRGLNSYQVVVETQAGGAIAIRCANLNGMHCIAEAIRRFVDGVYMPLEGEDAAAYYTRANAYFDHEDYYSAHRDYSHAISLQPEHADAYANRGLVREELGQYGPAISDFEEVLRLRPGDAEAYRDRATAYAHQAGLYPKLTMTHRDYARRAADDLHKALELSDDPELRGQVNEVLATIDTH